MFILYSVLFGLVVGFLVGGRPAGLAGLHIRWSPVILAGLLVQVALFSGPVSERVGALGPPIYMASTAMVIGTIVANRAVPGMLIVAAGALSNFAAILANGGYMPADAGALAALGSVPTGAYSNSSFVADPVLAPLTDIFATPVWLPFANVFSIGDVVIGIGIAVVIASAMRSGVRRGSSATTASVLGT